MFCGQKRRVLRMVAALGLALALVAVHFSDSHKAFAYTSLWWSTDYGSAQDWGCTNVTIEFTTASDSRWGYPSCDGAGDRWVHEGMDFSLPSGTAIYAGRAGTALCAGWGCAADENLGISVRIRVDSADIYLGHLNSVVVGGGAVAAGTLLGYSGNTGASLGPHLHFEVRPAGGGFNSSILPDGYWGAVKGLGLHNDLTSGEMLTSNGEVLGVDGGTQFGAGEYPNVTQPRFGWDIARSLVECPDASGAIELDGYGGLHGVGRATPSAPDYFGWDIARHIGYAKNFGCSRGWYMDGYGGMHVYGNAPVLNTGVYWSGWDIARSFAVTSDGLSGYVLDGYGGTHAFGNAPSNTGSPFWGWDIARDIVITRDSPCCQGYTLDGYGGLHPWGGAPALTTSPPYHSGQDTAKAVALFPPYLNSGNASGRVVDAYGVRGAFYS